ncbi:MAG: Fructose-1,6-bisphosphatase, type I [Candidatus Saccharicenans subterraneus]|uniref:Fructose-1,6-bisphosphatase class 1 n=1 Tax=Candidatus Saccharicenans subterraneus TaxID=2508984 RepID=A0A3E2BKU0_9BACT|nr:MAG: Fructose-1,6-bisphosphatase, type I [Candidatus Saccharicenans subterraneum]
MLNFEITFMDFLLEHQERHGRTYHFLILMNSILNAAKRIQHYYLTGALKGNLGLSGLVNIQGEKVMKLDQIANEVVKHYLARSGRVIYAVSEEEDEIIPMNAAGRYFVYYDPMDGSSNIPHNLPVGFLFGIAKRNLEGPEDGHLRAGQEFIASGMFVIPTGTFTIALKEAGCWRFHIDETMNFVKPTRMQLPSDRKSWELSFNSAHREYFAPAVRDWLNQNETKYQFRYLGALAGDFHRILSNGGLFLYPAIVNHPDPGKNYPQGKLRLMYEAAVVSFMCREAGGRAVDENGQSILEIKPEHLHQRTALYLGSSELVAEIEEVLKKERAKT